MQYLGNSFKQAVKYTRSSPRLLHLTAVIVNLRMLHDADNTNATCSQQPMVKY